MLSGSIHVERDASETDGSGWEIFAGYRPSGRRTGPMDQAVTESPPPGRYAWASMPII
jgi:hypothetical protein